MTSTAIVEPGLFQEEEEPQSKVKPVMLTALGIKRIKRKKEEFLNLVEKNRNKKWYVCSHDNPDPGSIASALGMQRILNCLEVDDVELVYCGEISHPQNRAMVNVLSVNIKRWTKQMEELRGDAVFLFVDCVGNQKNMSIPFEPIAAIDHHKLTPAKEVLFIHDEVGACSTLVVDLGLSIPVKQLDEDETSDEGEPESEPESNYGCFNPNEEGVKEIVTALAIGIKTDTLDFRSETTTEYDFKAYKFLSRLLSDDKFQKIVNYELPSYIFDSEEIAWKNRNVNCTPNLITYLNYLDESKSDCIPYLADKLKRLQGVQTVVVYGIVGNTVRGSVRTSSSSIDAQMLCDALFGEGNGGAKHGIGGARVQFNVFNPTTLNDENRDRLSVLVKSHIEAEFQKVMNQ